MTYNERQRIAAVAIELIELLEDCDDYGFVDFIIECVSSGDSNSITDEDTERELPY